MLTTSDGVFGLPHLFSLRAFHGKRLCSQAFSSCVSCVSLRLFTPASVCADVVGVDINVLDIADVDVGNDIGGAGVMGVDIGGAVCVGVLVGVFFLPPRFVCLVVCLVDGSSSFRSGSCLA